MSNNKLKHATFFKKMITSCRFLSKDNILIHSISDECQQAPWSLYFALYKGVVLKACKKTKSAYFFYILLRNYPFTMGANISGIPMFASNDHK
jgi:hypothetical protein